MYHNKEDRRTCKHAVRHRLFAGLAALVVAAALLMVPAIASAKTMAAGTAARPAKTAASSFTSPQAKAAAQPPQPLPRTRAAWRADMAKVPAPGSGCYQAAAYPVLAWDRVKCAAGPKWPLAPVSPSRSARHAAPSVVGGNGDDYEAQVTKGSISSATGSFRNVSSGILEQGQVDGAGSQVANAYSLQLNTQQFASPLCTAGSGCTAAWQQFLYTYSSASFSYIYMQYWLLGHNRNCPSGWIYFAGSATEASGCFVNSGQTQLPTQPASELASMRLTGSATPGGNDTVSLSVGSGPPVMASASDTMLDLAGNWQSTQWGVYGDAGGGQANFQSGDSLEAVTALTDISDSQAPAFTEGSFTAETNNLNLAPTPALTPGPDPMMASEQTTAAQAQPPAPPAVSAGTAPSILTVGDSISNGILGDYTWRYRLWQDLTASGADPKFVGHRTGTENIYDDPSDLDLISGQPTPADNYGNPTDGYYEGTVSPPFLQAGGDNHDALWGWTYVYAQNYITQEVQTYQPKYMLIELGFNDLAFYTSPSATLANAKALINDARSVDPGIKVLIANVITRVPLPEFPDLNTTIQTYNSDLAGAAPGWSTAQSPVHIADISSGYNANTMSYDGLHPNWQGEYEIGDAFATALAQDYGVGSVPGAPPSSVPGYTLTTPTSVTATLSATGTFMHWSQSYGVSGYRVYERDITGNPSPLPAFTELPLPIPGDHWYAGWGTPGHTYQYEIAAAKGDAESVPSAPVSITMPDPEPTADPPANITAAPSSGTTSIAMKWTAPTGAADDGNVDRYDVYWQNATAAAACGCALVPNVAYTTGTSYTITGLVPGDTYDMAVASHTSDHGEGPWGGVGQAIVGDGTPAAPVISAGPNNTLTWSAVPGAAGYWVYSGTQAIGSPVTWTRLPYEVPQGWNGSLVPGLYSVTAANGTLESAKSNSVAFTTAGARKLAATVPSTASWIPAWLRAMPGAPTLAMLEERA